MSHRQLAATPWEVEAERRREVLAHDLARPSRSDHRPWFADLGARVRGLFAGAPAARKLDQKQA